MRLSARSYYGLRGMAHLAKEERPCSVRKISQEENIPEKYLEKIFQKLKKANLLKSLKGNLGGYFLAFPAKRVSLGRIIAILEGEIITAPCFRKRVFLCPQRNDCDLKTFWGKLGLTINKALEKITLDQLE